MYLIGHACIHVDMGKPIVINLIQDNDNVHAVHGSARVRSTPHTQIELTENSDDVYTWKCPYHSPVAVNGP